MNAAEINDGRIKLSDELIYMRKYLYTPFFFFFHVRDIQTYPEIDVM